MLKRAGTERFFSGGAGTTSGKTPSAKAAVDTVAERVEGRLNELLEPLQGLEERLLVRISSLEARFDRTLQELKRSGGGGGGTHQQQQGGCRERGPSHSQPPRVSFGLPDAPGGDAEDKDKREFAMMDSLIESDESIKLVVKELREKMERREKMAVAGESSGSRAPRRLGRGVSGKNLARHDTASLRDSNNVDRLSTASVGSTSGAASSKASWLRRRRTNSRFQRLLTALLGPVLHPEGRFRSVWNVGLAFLIAYCGISVPLEIAFERDILRSMCGQLLTCPNYDAWSWTNIVVDLVFICDVMINMRTGYAIEGHFVDNDYDALTHYLNPMTGSFVLDFLGSFPLNLILMGFNDVTQDDAASDATRVNRMLRLLRLTKLFKLARLTKLATYLEYLVLLVKFNPGLLRIVRLGLVSFLCCHWFGCIWWLIADIELTVDYNLPVPWMVENQWHPPAWLRNNERFIVQYAHAFFWGAGMVTSMVPYDVMPVTALECFVTAFTMFCGLLLNAVVISSFASAIFSMDSKQNLVGKDLDTTRNYLILKAVPADLRSRILEYCEYKLTSTQALISNVDILKSMPQNLSAQLALTINRRIVASGSDFFSGFTNASLILLLETLEPLVFVPQQLIVSEGLPLVHVYFINRGVVHMVKAKGSEEEELVKVISDSDNFGLDDYLAQGDPKKVSCAAISVTYCDMVSLSVDDLKRAFQRDASVRPPSSLVSERESNGNDRLKACVRGVRSLAKVGLFNRAALAEASGSLDKAGDALADSEAGGRQRSASSPTTQSGRCSPAGRSSPPQPPRRVITLKTVAGKHVRAGRLLRRASSSGNMTDRDSSGQTSDRGSSERAPTTVRFAESSSLAVEPSSAEPSLAELSSQSAGSEDTEAPPIAPARCASAPARSMAQAAPSLMVAGTNIIFSAPPVPEPLTAPALQPGVGGDARAKDGEEEGDRQEEAAEDGGRQAAAGSPGERAARAVARSVETRASLGLVAVTSVPELDLRSTAGAAALSRARSGSGSSAAAMDALNPGVCTSFSAVGEDSDDALDPDCRTPGAAGASGEVGRRVHDGLGLSSLAPTAALNLARDSGGVTEPSFNSAGSEAPLSLASSWQHGQSNGSCAAAMARLPPVTPFRMAALVDTSSETSSLPASPSDRSFRSVTATLVPPSELSLPSTYHATYAAGQQTPFHLRPSPPSAASPQAAAPPPGVTAVHQQPFHSPLD